MKKVPISGRHCPACGNEIGWSPGLKSLWPLSLTCPYCDEDLAYIDIRNVTILIVLVVIAICVVAFFIAAYLVPFQYALLRIGLTAMFMMILWIPVMALSGMYLRSHELLALKNDESKGRYL
jgi:hypothetical protein